MIGELAASLSHELKQPITAAITNAKTCLRWLTRDQPDLDEAREATMRTMNDGTRAAEIIDRLRSFYKKGPPPERELVDVNELVREMLVLVRSEAGRYSIRMRTELAAELPRVVADRVQLQQVLMNLVMNSIDAMKDAEGLRELTIQSGQDGNGQVLISVSDTGVGLPPRQAARVWGWLPISRSIVESHGGRLWAADNSPRGAIFHFTLPARAAAHA
jgi:signal transduction histidine kinase